MLFNDFIKMCEVLDDPENDSSRFDRLLETSGDCKFDGVDIDGSVVSSIKRFYINTNEYNRSKVSGLINNSITNLKDVHRIVIDYDTARNINFIPDNI